MLLLFKVYHVDVVSNNQYFLSTKPDVLIKFASMQFTCEIRQLFIY